MHRDRINRFSTDIVLALLFVVVFRLVQIAIAVVSYIVAVMVAHGSAPK
jgi:hypothetical protein